MGILSPFLIPFLISASAQCWRNEQVEALTIGMSCRADIRGQILYTPTPPPGKCPSRGGVCVKGGGGGGNQVSAAGGLKISAQVS